MPAEILPADLLAQLQHLAFGHDAAEGRGQTPKGQVLNAKC